MSSSSLEMELIYHDNLSREYFMAELTEHTPPDGQHPQQYQRTPGEREVYLCEKAEHLATEAAELDKRHAHLERNHTELSKQRCEQVGKMARTCSHRVHEQIMCDENGVPHFARGSQNMVAATMILRSIPEPRTPRDCASTVTSRGCLGPQRSNGAESSLQ